MMKHKMGIWIGYREHDEKPVDTGGTILSDKTIFAADGQPHIHGSLGKPLFYYSIHTYFDLCFIFQTCGISPAKNMVSTDLRRKNKCKKSDFD